MVERPSWRFPPAARALERELSSRELDLRLMAGDSAGNLFENIPQWLTRVSAANSRRADDDPNFHIVAHLCTP
jgi:hypothetical protein